MNGVLLKLRLPKARSIDWRTVQDEEHILLKCLHEHQANLRNQHQLVFPSQYEDSPTRFTGNQMCLVLPVLWLSA